MSAYPDGHCSTGVTLGSSEGIEFVGRSDGTQTLEGRDSGVERGPRCPRPSLRQRAESNSTSWASKRSRRSTSGS